MLRSLGILADKMQRYVGKTKAVSAAKDMSEGSRVVDVCNKLDGQLTEACAGLAVFCALALILVQPADGLTLCGLFIFDLELPPNCSSPLTRYLFSARLLAWHPHNDLGSNQSLLIWQRITASS
jgi:hypothetical protein